jgi:hypothetical protein
MATGYVPHLSFEKVLEAYYEAGTWRCMLILDTYTPNVDTLDFRSDLTSHEVANGNGYTTNGVIVVPTVTRDDATNKVIVTFPQAQWTSATITAAGAAYYRETGSAATDPVHFFNDFDANVTSTAATFTANACSFEVDFPG